MALKPCKECGHNVSTLAENCPNCGAPIEKGYLDDGKIPCPSCNKRLKLGSDVCPYCQHKFSTAEQLMYFALASAEVHIAQNQFKPENLTKQELSTPDTFWNAISSTVKDKYIKKAKASKEYKDELFSMLKDCSVMKDEIQNIINQNHQDTGSPQTFDEHKLNYESTLVEIFEHLHHQKIDSKIEMLKKFQEQMLEKMNEKDSESKRRFINKTNEPINKLERSKNKDFKLSQPYKWIFHRYEQIDKKITEINDNLNIPYIQKPIVIKSSANALFFPFDLLPASILIIISLLMISLLMPGIAAVTTGLGIVLIYFFLFPFSQGVKKPIKLKLNAINYFVYNAKKNIEERLLKKHIHRAYLADLREYEKKNPSAVVGNPGTYD